MQKGQSVSVPKAKSQHSPDNGAGAKVPVCPIAGHISVSCLWRSMDVMADELASQAKQIALLLSLEAQLEELRARMVVYEQLRIKPVQKPVESSVKNM